MLEEDKMLRLPLYIRVISTFFEASNIVVGKKITDTFLKTNYSV